MTTRRIPADAFAFYASLGPDRSYEAVATHFGVSKRGIAKLALREDWQGQIARAEREARERGHQKLVESLEEMNERHLKTLKAIQARALEALRNTAMVDPTKAALALVKALQMERVVRGEPADKAELSVIEMVRVESERLLTWKHVEEPDEDETEPEAGEASAPAHSCEVHHGKAT